MNRARDKSLARFPGRTGAALCPEDLGEVRTAVVLFTDIRHFSRLAEQISLLDLRRFLNDFVRLLVEAVETRGGMVNKFAGDGALALFASDSLEAAACAALAGCAAFRKLCAARKQENPVFAGLDLAAGLHQGEVFLGNIGGKGYYDFTAIGSTVNVAQRLAAEAPEGGVYCSAAVQGRLDAAQFPAHPLGTCHPRGMSAELDLFRLQEV